MALSLNPMAVFGAMGSKRELPPPPSKTPKKKPLSNRDRQTPPARVKTPKSSLRPRSSSSSRPNSSGAEMMKLIDALVESMPAQHQELCVRVMSRMDPSHRRVFTEILSEVVTDEDQQLRAFVCCDSLLSKYGPTSCEALVTAFQDDAEEAGMIVDLHACFVEERWRELPELPRQQRTELIDLMRKMTHAEQKKVGRACGKLLPMVCVLQLLNELPPKYCPLCRIKRAHEEQYLLEQGLEEETSQNKLALPFTPDVYCFEERSEDPSDA